MNSSYPPAAYPSAPPAGAPVFPTSSAGGPAGRPGGPGGSGGSGAGGSGGMRPGRPPRLKPRRLIDYPRYGRTGWTRWLPSWLLITGLIGSAFLTLALGVIIGYATTKVPDARPSVDAQTTTVTYSDGSVLARFAQQNRTIVPLESVPEKVQWEVISAEDRSFYDNHGISLPGILRAAWNNARGGSTQGGSTITQQYVKNTRISSDRTWRRKISEFFISIKVANGTSKKEVLGNYLNTIYFGRSAYGIQAAAQAYFGVNVDKLTVHQGAYLAGIINGPELYDPDDGAKAIQRATARMNYVLDGMVEMHQLEPLERAKYTKLPKVKKATATTGAFGGSQAGYLVPLIRAEAKRRFKLTDTQLDTGGFRITTSLDPKLIQKGVDSVDETLGARKKWTKGTEVGMVSIEPTTGQIKAIYGGDGNESFSAATDARPQAGSTFKTFALLAAVGGEKGDGSDGISLHSRFDAYSPHTWDADIREGSKTVSNYGTEYRHEHAYLDLLQATAHSVNTVFAQLNEQMGHTGQRTRKAVMDAMGLAKDDPDMNLGNEISNLLGNATPTVKQLATGYATIANHGVYMEPHAITAIKTADGAPAFDASVNGRGVFNSDVVADVTYALQQPPQYGTATAARLGDRPIAGKTGTVGSGGSRDSLATWFVGYTPQLVTATAMYREEKVKKVIDGEEKEVANPLPVIGWGRFAGKTLAGGDFTARLWKDYMEKALDGVPSVDFDEPAWVGERVGPPPPAPKPDPLPTPSASAVDPNASPSPSAATPGEPSPSGGLSFPPIPGLPVPPTGNPATGGPGNGNGNGNGNGGVVGPQPTARTSAARGLLGQLTGGGQSSTAPPG